MTEHKNQSKTMRFLKENTLLVSVLALVVLAVPVAIVSNSKNENRDSFAQTVPTPTPRYVYVEQYGTTTQDVQNAANAAADAILVFPSNVVYTITSPIRLPSNVVVQGNNSTLKTPDNSTTTTTSDALMDIEGRTTVDISGLTFDGNIQNQGGIYAQWRHAIRIHGSNDVKIHNNTFVNLMGDGVYVNHIPTASAPYNCPSMIDIFSNQFTGTHQNRNGISVICQKDSKIHDNTFFQMARPDMPGSIDLEPNNANEYLTNLEIYNNTVDGGTTPKTVSGILLFNDRAHAPANNIAIHNNTIRGPQLRYGVVIRGALAPVTGINITANNIQNLKYDTNAVAIDVDGGAVGTITGNIVNDITGWGIRTDLSCMTISGNTVTNTTNPAISESGRVCPTITPTTSPTATTIPTTVPTATSVPTPTKTPTPIPSDVTAPSVSITSPLNNAVVARSRVTTIVASASDNVGVQRVEFYVNGVLKCTDTTATYSCAWSVPSKRNVSYTLTAKAYDAAGNSKTSTSITVYVR